MLQADVQRGDDDVQRGEGGVIEIEPAVAMDLDLGTGEKAELAGSIDLVDLESLGGQLLRRETVGDAEAVTVIRDREKPIAASRRGGRHFGDRGGAVAPGGMTVELAIDVRYLDEARDLASALDLRGAKAQLRRDPGQIERGVNGILRGCLRQR